MRTAVAIDDDAPSAAQRIEHRQNKSVDKSTWKEDIAAFTETCALVGVPAAIERSGSGNGAHAWFFFASPVAQFGQTNGVATSSRRR